jgi:integrase
MFVGFQSGGLRKISQVAMPLFFAVIFSNPTSTRRSTRVWICAASPPLYAALWRLMAAHALRISEALSLCAGDVDCGFLTIKRLKGSQKTTQPLLVDLSAQITSGTYRLFPVHRSSAFLHFRAAARKVGLHPDLRHPHVLRHSCVNWLLQGGVPLNVASTYVGHTSLSSTAQYLNCSDLRASAAAREIIGIL